MSRNMRTYFYAVLGGIGGLVGWQVSNLLGLSFGPNLYVEELLVGALVGLCVGLFIGLTVGRVTDFRPAPLDSRARAVPAPVAQPREALQPAAVQPKATEEELFSRAEQAQSELQVPAELEALSAITPMREVALRLPSGR